MELLIASQGARGGSGNAAPRHLRKDAGNRRFPEQQFRCVCRPSAFVYKEKIMSNKIRALLISSLALAVLVMAGLSAPASAKRPSVMKGGKMGTVVLVEETQVGTASLQPGEYHVFCEQSGGDHQMVFIRLSKVGGRYYSSLAETSSVTRIPCRMEALSQKAGDWRVETFQDASGRRVLREIVIEGESMRHLFAD